MFLDFDFTARRRVVCRAVGCPIWLAAIFCTVGAYADAPKDEQTIDFRRDVLPILSENCFQCHGPDADARQAELRLDTPDGLFGQRSGSPAFVPGKPQNSEAIRRLMTADEDERMPPPDSRQRPSPEQIAVLNEWVKQGAQWKRHWAFEPLHPQLAPNVSDAAWPLNAIDRFVLARLEERGWAPSPESPRETLIRRVTLDLTGLPPTPAEVDAFFADRSADAYEKVVDRLLASPRYGERMVWDWLDAARYADSSGYQGDPERTMWPWRDWVIGAMNDNMPFDQFTIEQLAGDLLPGATLDQRVATGFNRNHMYNGEGGRIPEETRVENVMDRAETTATVWLGLTMTCARCHDHKYDPLTMRDYYAWYAFFNNTSENGGGRGGQVPPTATVIPQADRQRLAELQLRIEELAKRVEDAEQTLADQDTRGLSSEAGNLPHIPPEIAKLLEQQPRERSEEQLQRIYEEFKDSQPEYTEHVARLLEAVRSRESVRSNLPRVMVMDELEKSRETFILSRGAYDQPGERVTAALPASLGPPERGHTPSRLQLARWLVSPENPLTARVIVNRHWQTFFGTGLVRTSEDFGTQGELPSHPGLLDRLAQDFVRSGWDVKQLHRQIVTSAAYRQSSRTTRELLEHDRDNRLLARGPRFRWPSWMIRDQALFAGGLLVESVGGPAVKPYQPAGVWSEATFGKKQYAPDHGEKLYRRSVYTFWRRIVGPTMFFDVANRQTCSVKLIRTNTPLHALATLNDVTFVESARALAERVIREGAGTPDESIAGAFRLVTGRRPKPHESEILCRRLETLRTQFAAERSAAGELLSVGESAADQTVDPVHHAALASLCLLILNLDETLSKQ